MPSTKMLVKKVEESGVSILISRFGTWFFEISTI